MAVGRGREKPFGRLEIVVQLILELLEELMTDRQIRGGRVHDQHEAQHDAVPAGQPNTDRRRHPRHGSPSRRTNPTPRTV